MRRRSTVDLASHIRGFVDLPDVVTWSAGRFYVHPDRPTTPWKGRRSGGSDGERAGSRRVVADDDRRVVPAPAVPARKGLPADRGQIARVPELRDSSAVPQRR